MTVEIVDVHSGAAFDIRKIIADGKRGVIFKAGQGYASYKWRDRAELCNALNFPWGVYWVVDARYSPEKHKAKIKEDFANKQFGDLGLWLDVEKPRYKMTDEEYLKLPYKYYRPIESIVHGVWDYSDKRPGIYTSPGMYKLCFGIVPPDVEKFFGSLPLWTAQYGTDKPDMYGGWQSEVFWQYRAEPDYSIYNGTDAEFVKRFIHHDCG